MKNTIKIFVYGTLKQGKGLNESYMNNSTFIKTDTVKGKLYSLGGYPGLKRGNNDVPGEIFEMPIEDFNRLKTMEEGAGYTTETIKTNNGEKIQIFFYNNKVNEKSLITEW